MIRTRLITVCALLCLSSSVIPQDATLNEQTTFSQSEAPNIPIVRRPVRLPETVLAILKKDITAQSCLSENPVSPDRPFSSWFVASAIHLDGDAEVDMVVLPRSDPQPTYMCFHSVEGIGWFWIFRLRRGDSQLVLKAAGNGMRVLRSIHKKYRDIETGTLGQAGKYVTTTTYWFDGSDYRAKSQMTKESQ